MALYENGILVSGANTLPQMTLAEYQALPVSERPTYWERTDLNYSDLITEISFSGTTTAQGYIGIAVPSTAIVVEVLFNDGVWCLRTSRSGNSLYATGGNYAGSVVANTAVSGVVRVIEA